MGKGGFRFLETTFTAMAFIITDFRFGTEIKHQQFTPSFPSHFIRNTYEFGRLPDVIRECRWCVCRLVCDVTGAGTCVCVFACVCADVCASVCVCACVCVRVCRFVCRRVCDVTGGVCVRACVWLIVLHLVPQCGTEKRLSPKTGTCILKPNSAQTLQALKFVANSLYLFPGFRLLVLVSGFII